MCIVLKSIIEEIVVHDFLKEPLRNREKDRNHKDFGKEIKDCGDGKSTECLILNVFSEIPVRKAERICADV